MGWERANACLMGKLTGKWPDGRPKSRWDFNIKIEHMNKVVRMGG
jgi:hypothetical protein